MSTVTQGAQTVLQTESSPCAIKSAALQDDIIADRLDTPLSDAYAGAKESALGY